MPLRIRMLLLGVLALVALAAPLTMYLTEATKSVTFTATERRGMPVIVAGQRLVRELGGVRRAVVRRQIGDPGARAELDRAVALVEQELSDFGASLGTELVDDGFRKDFDQFLESWRALKERVASDRYRVAVVTRQVTSLIDHALTLIERTADHYLLSLDPEPESYFLLISMIQYLPRWSELLAAARNGTIAALGEGGMNNAADARRIHDLVTAVDTPARQAVWTMSKAFAASPVAEARLKPVITALHTDSEALLQRMRDVANGGTAAGAARDLQADTERIVEMQRSLSESTASIVASMLESREAHLTWKRSLMAAVAIGLFSLFAVGGVLVVASVAGPLRELVAAAHAMRDGTFSAARVTPATDEIGKVGEAFIAMKSTFEGFAHAQSQMADAHAAGNIDERIPADRFRGGYGDIARKMNLQVDAQIRETFQFTEVVRQYGRGDFTATMPTLPGRKAELTTAAAEVRSSLELLSGEIGKLGEAAARGNFQARGDAQQFEFAYRDLVLVLNRLMSSAESGLADANRMFAALARGNLVERVTTMHEGMFAQMKVHSNATMDQLGAMIRDINGGATALQAAAESAAERNAAIAQRTEAQAAALRDASQSMKEIADTVVRNASDAARASGLAQESSIVAERGGRAVEAVVAMMDGVEASSRRVHDIIHVIDGIAFQTNILALNAAVEAARAGDAGRGFAVVASEVRGLAQRSASASREIASLIAESANRTKEGKALVGTAGNEMEQTVQAVRRMAEVIDAIRAASDEQARAISHVNATVSDMDRTTRENATLVDESALAAKEMEHEVGRLVDACSAFTLPPDRRPHGTRNAMPVAA